MGVGVSKCIRCVQSERLKRNKGSDFATQITKTERRDMHSTIHTRQPAKSVCAF